MKPWLNRKFLKVLRVELEDLHEDIELLIADTMQRFRAHSITEHVCFENIAVLRSEEYGIRHFVEIVDATDPEAFETLDVLSAHLKQAFEQEIERAGLARAATILAERKIDKVAQYVGSCLEWVQNNREAIPTTG